MNNDKLEGNISENIDNLINLTIIILREISNFIFININLNNYAKLIFNKTFFIK